MCFSQPSMPAAPQPIKNPVETDPAIAASVEADRRRRAAAAGLASTILTGGLGVAPIQGQGKTLTGS